MNNSILNHFKKVDPKIYKAMTKVNFDDWIKTQKKHDYFVILCKEIIGQQLSGKAASTIINRFTNLLPKGTITPKHVLAIPDQDLRNVGMSWAKVSYVKNLAKAKLDKSVKFTKFDSLSDEEIIKELTSVKGIGPWTAEMFLIFTLHRPNVFSFGDLGLKNGFTKVYGIEKPTKKDIEPIIEKWSPYKSYGSITLWHTLDNR